MVTLQPGTGQSEDAITHTGEEFVYCLEGSVSYSVNGETYHLKSGDSLLFAALQPHGFRNDGATPARLLIVCQVTDAKYPVAQRHLDG